MHTEASASRYPACYFALLRATLMPRLARNDVRYVTGTRVSDHGKWVLLLGPYLCLLEMVEDCFWISVLGDCGVASSCSGVIHEAFWVCYVAAKLLNSWHGIRSASEFAKFGKDC